MADMTPQERGAFERLGPTNTGFRAPTTLAITNSAATLDLNGSWGAGSTQGVDLGEGISVDRVKKGGAWVTLEARSTNVYVRFVPTGTGAGATTTNAAMIQTSTK